MPPARPNPGSNTVARRRTKLTSEINVVPYIDVMLVLLVIFMIATPVLTQGIKIDLPEVDAPVTDPQELVDPLIVTVDADGSYFINLGSNDGDRLVTRAAVAEYVEKIMRNRADTPIFVRGAATADYGEVLAILSLIQRAGAPSVNLITIPPPSSLDT